MTRRGSDHGLEFLLAFDGRIHHLEKGYWLKFIPRPSSLSRPVSVLCCRAHAFAALKTGNCDAPIRLAVASVPQMTSLPHFSLWRLEERPPPDEDIDVAWSRRRRPVDEIHISPVWRYVELRAPVSRSDEWHP